MLGILLGTNGVSLGRSLNAKNSPSVEIITKIEALFGWPASEQIDLIPLRSSDLRYSMVLHQVLEEWKRANPRTTPAAELRSAFDTKYSDPFGWKAKAEREASGE